MDRTKKNVVCSGINVCKAVACSDSICPGPAIERLSEVVVFKLEPVFFNIPERVNTLVKREYFYFEEFFQSSVCIYERKSEIFFQTFQFFLEISLLFSYKISVYHPNN